MVVSSECASKQLLYDLKETEDSCICINDDDEEDALSLCDLPIYNISSSNSFSSSNPCEYQEEANTDFDFFSGELGAGDVNDIVFCGKIICRKDVVDQNHPTVMPEKQSALFSWKKFKIASFRKSASKKKVVDESKLMCSTGSDSKKVSTLLTCPTKSRWYLFMFGQTRFPQAMTMDLSDLKNRQQRRRCSPSPSMNVTAKERGGRGRGVWSLLRESVTSVGKANTNDVVRAVGCISLV